MNRSEISITYAEIVQLMAVFNIVVVTGVITHAAGSVNAVGIVIVRVLAA